MRASVCMCVCMISEFFAFALLLPAQFISSCPFAPWTPHTHTHTYKARFAFHLFKCAIQWKLNSHNCKRKSTNTTHVQTSIYKPTHTLLCTSDVFARLHFHHKRSPCRFVGDQNTPTHL